MIKIKCKAANNNIAFIYAILLNTSQIKDCSFRTTFLTGNHFSHKGRNYSWEKIV